MARADLLKKLFEEIAPKYEAKGRAIRFKQKKNRIYVYMKEETKDEQ